MGKLTSTVTPQGIVGVSPFLDVGHRRAVRRRVRRDPARGARSRERRHGAPLGRRRRRRRRGVHGQLGRSVQPEDGAFVGRVDLPSADRPGRGRRRPRCEAARDRGLQILAMDGAAIRTSTPWTSSGPHRVRVRERGARPARGDPGDGGRAGPRSASREGRVAEPRGGRHRLPVRVGAPSSQRRRRPGDDRGGGGARHPLAAHGDEGVRLRPREAVGVHDRGAADADAPRDRVRRRPDGRDPAACWSTPAGWRPAPSSCSPSASTSRSSRSASSGPFAATPSTPRSAGPERPTSWSRTPPGQERAPVVHRGAGLVGPRGTDHDRGRAGGRPSASHRVARGDRADREDAERLFEARRPGTGAGSKIGLYVARGVAETQGGRAWADVKDGRLSFHLETPLLHRGLTRAAC